MTLAPAKLAAINRAKQAKEIKRLEARVKQLTAALMLTKSYLHGWEGATTKVSLMFCVDSALNGENTDA